MPQETSSERILKVFLASPGDVVEERDALGNLVREINDVLAYLAPERGLSLELVRYETHAYPDIGAPQDVINRQIPVDYDIFVGVMWRRCGTPTRGAPSGTIEEFRRACEKRKQGHLPRIMFYFCDQPIPIPDASELEQLKCVIEFREEVSKLGLTWQYPAHADFREHVRAGLLRAIREILHEEAQTPRSQVRADQGQPSDPSAKAELLKLAEEYDDIRRRMTSGPERTRQMTAIFSRMRAGAAQVRMLLDEFRESPSPGVRLIAIAILQMFPRADCLDWLAHRLDNPETEKPFVGFQAAVAILEAVRALSNENCPALAASLAKAKDLGARLIENSDRLHVLATAERELNRKCRQP